MSKRYDSYRGSTENQYHSPYRSRNVNYSDSQTRSSPSSNYRPRGSRSSYDGRNVTPARSSWHSSPNARRTLQQASKRPPVDYQNQGSSESLASANAIQLPDYNLDEKRKDALAEHEETTKKSILASQQFIHELTVWEKLQSAVFRETLRSETAEKSLEGFANNYSLPRL
ncbi:small histone ubiquitination factor Shf1 [Schizosaccharomyces japonicus yFS275]|uniref:Small histone ubiquitination factor Shf1 n=1 Tax=Schizosaccharomyces japonicus (strain yFS275 / FY16936) TaxID=402676 RepID=B6JVB3_SCHJY|nr:small histone ubiquitination factor Shf1 [Schizosaccharomyces japonicus yFS275]EEB05314.1 small histone ubiquitination factor Shf1 [Schizosaccharomyces japonicus yFS275]